MKKVSDPDEVDELVQRTLVKLYENHEHQRDIRNVKAWLYRVANNVIMDHFREKKRTENVRAEDLWYELPSPSVNQELAECIQPFIKALPEPHATLLIETDIKWNALISTDS